MDNMLNIIKNNDMLTTENARKELRVCNDFTQKFGLKLTEENILELVQCRAEALKNSGRIELGGGVLPKIIYAFCDSAYIEQENYVSILEELQEAFYYFKSEAEDLYTDDELIEFMVSVFNGRAQGSTEYLIGTSLGELCRYARSGYNPNNSDEAGDLF